MTETETSEDHSGSEKTKLKFIGNLIVAALDALRFSDYQVLHFITAVATSLGHDILEYLEMTP